MYYDEKLIDGIWHWRGTPDGEWRPMTPEMLNRRMVEMRDEHAESCAALARKDALLKQALGPIRYAARVAPRAFYAMMEPEEVEAAKESAQKLDALAARIEAELEGINILDAPRSIK